MKLDYRSSCRDFVMTVIKKAQKRGTGLIQKGINLDTVMAELGFRARPEFKASSITYWIYHLGRLMKKAHKISPDDTH